jgi:glutamate racemase
VQSGAYRAAIAKLNPRAEVIERACPLFVALAEEGWAETNVAQQVAAEYLRGLKDEVDALVLGCTHYPILRRVIQDELGSGVRLIDSGEAAAQCVAAILKEHGLARSANAVANTSARARKLCDDLDHFYVTDAAERFSRVAERFLGSAPSVLEAVEVWGTDELHTH